MIRIRCSKCKRFISRRTARLNAGLCGRCFTGGIRIIAREAMKRRKDAENN